MKRRNKEKEAKQYRRQTLEILNFNHFNLIEESLWKHFHSSIVNCYFHLVVKLVRGKVRYPSFPLDSTKVVGSVSNTSKRRAQ